MATPKKSALLGAAPENFREGVSYTRYSTVEQGSTEEQQGINEELAADNDITLVASFHDEGLSRSLSERPGLLEVFDYIETHPRVRFLLVNELERLTAGIGQRQQITALCKRLSITIVTEDMGLIDPHDDEKMHEADQRSVASQGELLKVRRRTKRSLRAIVRKGKSVVMRPCYGIRMVPLVTPDGVELPSGVSMIDSSGKRVNSGAIELHPDEYPVLVRMFDWSAEGVGLSEIARRLNNGHGDHGPVPTKTGKGLWSSSTVVGILDNTFYKGEMTWGLQETRRDEHGKKYYVVRPKGDPGRIDMESPLGAIIDPATWDLAKSKREVTARSFNQSERKRQPRQVLDGRVYCLRCGHKMYGRNNASKAGRARGHVFWTYVCHSDRPAFREIPGYEKCTERHVMTLKDIFETLANFETSDGRVSAVRGAAGDTGAEGRHQEERIAKAREVIDRATDFALNGDITPAKLRQTKEAQEAIIADAESRLRALSELGDVVVEPLGPAVAEGLATLVQILKNEALPLTARIALLDEFGLEKLYIDKPLLRLHLRG